MCGHVRPDLGAAGQTSAAGANVVIADVAAAGGAGVAAPDAASFGRAAAVRSHGSVDARERKRREIIAKQLANKDKIDAEVVEHFKEEEATRGLVPEAFECSSCMDDVEAYSGVRCAPGNAECDHKMC